MTRVAPRRIRLEASSFCQLRCPSCPTTTGTIHPAIGSGFLEFEHFRRLIDLNPLLEVVEISNYGEIFLNPQLLRILQYAHAKGVAITIENGANLNNVRDELLEALVKYQVRILLCSIDGASRDTYRTYRVRGDFDTVIGNIEKINGFKQRYQSSLPHLIWQFVIFGHNEHEIPIAGRMAAQLGMEFRTKLTWDSDFSPIRDPAFVRTQTGGQPATREEFEDTYGEKYASGICHQLWDDPQINWNGKILGCCRNFWGDFGGNAFTDGLMESVNNEKMMYARDMLSGRKPPRNDIPCTTCEMYHARQDRRRFIDDAPASTSHRRSDEQIAQAIDRMIAEIDAEIACPTDDQEEFVVRTQHIKHRMIAPVLPVRRSSASNLPSPAVGIVLPTYNRAALVGEAIASVQAQSFKDWELIVVDDGSLDNTSEAVEGFLADPRIRYIRQGHLGQSAARNRGLRSRSVPLIAYIDSDNVWYPHFLETAVTALASLEEVDCVYGALVTEVHLASPKTILFESFDWHRLLRANYIDINTVVHRRSLIAVYGGFDEGLDRLADWDLLLRVTRHKPARRVPVLAAHYRVLDDQRVTATCPFEPNYAAIRLKWPLEVALEANPS